MGGADGLDGGADRNSNMAQVHTDQGVTDIDPGVCFYKFHCAGMLKAIPRGGGEGTAGLQLRFYIHHLKAIFLSTFFLDDQSSV